MFSSKARAILPRISSKILFKTQNTFRHSIHVRHHSIARVFVRHHSIARVCKPAPTFKADAVQDKKFVNLSLEDYKGKWLCLVFYPLDFTFVCPTELIEFSERLDEFKALGTEVVGVSVDSKFSHLAWVSQPRKEGGIENLRFPLLSDLSKKISTDYGVLVDNNIALRGTFLIDPKGIVRQITMNDFDIGRSVDETLRLLEALQFHDENGAVCPAGWKKGAKSMKADPVLAKEYFKSEY